MLLLPIMCDKRLSQPQLAEHIHHCLHGGLISHGDGCHVQNLLQFQWWRTWCLGWNGVHKQDEGLPTDSFKCALCICCSTFTYPSDMNTESYHENTSQGTSSWDKTSDVNIEKCMIVKWSLVTWAPVSPSPFKDQSCDWHMLKMITADHGKEGKRV